MFGSSTPPCSIHDSTSFSRRFTSSESFTPSASASTRTGTPSFSSWCFRTSNVSRALRAKNCRCCVCSVFTRSQIFVSAETLSSSSVTRAAAAASFSFVSASSASPRAFSSSRAAVSFWKRAVSEASLALAADRFLIVRPATRAATTAMPIAMPKESSAKGLGVPILPPADVGQESEVAGQRDRRKTGQSGVVDGHGLGGVERDVRELLGGALLDLRVELPAARAVHRRACLLDPGVHVRIAKAPAVPSLRRDGRREEDLVVVIGVDDALPPQREDLERALHHVLV